MNKVLPWFALFFLPAPLNAQSINYQFTEAVTDDYYDNSKDNNSDSIVSLYNTLTRSGSNLTWDFDKLFQEKKINTYQFSQAYSKSLTAPYTLKDTNLLSVTNDPYVSYSASFNEVTTKEAISWGSAKLHDGSTLNSVIMIKTTKESKFTGGYSSPYSVMRPDIVTCEWYHKDCGIPLMKIYWQKYYNGIHYWMRFTALESAQLNSVTPTIKIDEIEWFTFPNPAENIFNINYSNPDNITNVLLLNGLGNIVFQSEVKVPQIDISNLPSGIYMLQGWSKDGTVFTKRIIKK